MNRTDISTRKTIIAACALALSSTAILAQEIELYTSDGSLSLQGQLVEFVDQKYTIDTAIGRMIFDSNAVLCNGEACPALSSPTSAITIVGVGAQASNIMPKLLPSYAQAIGVQVNKASDGNYVLNNTEDEEIAQISLSNTLSSDSLPGLLKRQVAIALTSKPLLPEELSALNLEQRIGQPSNYEHVIGLNAVAIITAKENPITSISPDEIAKVFSGEYDNWSDLGGTDAPITLYGPQADSELAKLFESQLSSTQGDGASRLSQNIFGVESIAQRVSTNPNGIGYTYFANSQPAKTLDIKGVCGIATPANSFTIKAEEYPLTHRLYAYRLAPTNNKQVDTLLSFMQSGASQDIISSSGLINQRDASNSINNQGIRFFSAIAANASNAESELLREMVTQINGSQRLSTTLRFDTGSNQMDQRAQTDVVRLAEKLQLPENANSVVHLLGFTDSVGDFDLNQEVSLRRANQVRDALLEINAALAVRVSILPAGYGEIAPIACNETAQGRLINRRVEVWMDKGQ